MKKPWHPKQELEALGAVRSQPPKRAVRVADAIRNELSMLLVQRSSDPRLHDVQINRVTVTDDLRHAKIYFTTLPGGCTVDEARQALERAAGFMRSHLARTINLRFTPELRFWYDEGAERVSEVEKLLAEIAREKYERERRS
ncbi:30S ribosome-binding factor RbfA [Desulfofustis glycolicus]|uniref:Ribosome-binding factor A n=1 Tax=Desulfofustis glycolicus DSM 9705 TaxID=1121409 RepID=A0A1M5T1L9_9BACT|nr:30S ribosome-binding factor RbfA [Desulfofustis glycolicus]MCB2215309.1 30S ribosome-binding factor RbfA [Desulfobulbaceae bacterium]SHH44568.1 ribosome-binding factor A [Desulfofustis glycolicus DSM 9705]